MPKEYIHKKQELEGSHNYEEKDSEGSRSTTRTLSEKVLEYEGRKVLAIQKDTTCVSIFGARSYHKFVVVPGFVNAYRARKTEFGLDITEVEIVPEEMCKDLEAVLRQNGFEGGISFW